MFSSYPNTVSLLSAVEAVLCFGVTVRFLTWLSAPFQADTVVGPAAFEVLSGWLFVQNPYRLLRPDSHLAIPDFRDISPRFNSCVFLAFDVYLAAFGVSFYKWTLASKNAARVAFAICVVVWTTTIVVSLVLEHESQYDVYFATSTPNGPHVEMLRLRDIRFSSSMQELSYWCFSFGAFELLVAAAIPLL